MNGTTTAAVSILRRPFARIPVALRRQIAGAWTDVIIFSILVLVLVFFPSGLLGRVAPNKS